MRNNIQITQEKHGQKIQNKTDLEKKRIYETK